MGKRKDTQVLANVRCPLTQNCYRDNIVFWKHFNVEVFDHARLTKTMHNAFYVVAKVLLGSNTFTCIFGCYTSDIFWGGRWWSKIEVKSKVKKRFKCYLKFETGLNAWLLTEKYALNPFWNLKKKFFKSFIWHSLSCSGVLSYLKKSIYDILVSRCVSSSQS